MLGFKKLTEEEKKELEVKRAKESLVSEIADLMNKAQLIKDKQRDCQKKLDRL